MQQQDNNNQPKRKKIDWVFIIVLIVMVIAIIWFITSLSSSQVQTITYNDFYSLVENKNVVSAAASPAGGENYGLYEIEGIYQSSNGEVRYYVTLTGEQLNEIMAVDGLNFPIQINTISSNIFLTLLINFLPLIIMIIFFVIIFRNQGNGKAFDFGKSTARLTREKTVTFKDVAGCDEEKEELVEIIDFLRNPRKYVEVGARIPKGVLLAGPPGTGKTLLAKAVAGEANVPFFSISGSDFVEMFVGVGASRVRDMFKTAKENAPCIIFIDEIDAVGRQRGAGMGGGHDEREQTLNQLLVEMDGFNGNIGIIVMAATNRPDVLDPALLRPGRFDRQITINLPDVVGREAILRVHARNKHFDSTVNFKDIAHRIPGFSGADIENLLNEAALLAARENKKIISVYDIDEAIDRVMMGPAKKTRKMSETERKIVAFHEAGHAVIGLKLEDASVVQKVTIIPRGQAGGYNLMIPAEEHYLESKKSLTAKITGYLGGRVSEEINFHEVSTGASNDFQQATKIARAMVTEYGMSNLGPVQYEQPNGSVFLGRDYLKEKNFSDQIALEIDKETRNIIEECYERARKVILENLDLLKKIAYYLIKVETLTKSDIEEIEATGSLKWYEDKQKALAEEKNKPVEETTQETHTSNNNVEDNAQEHLDKTNDSNDIVISKPEDNDNETR